MVRLLKTVKLENSSYYLVRGELCQFCSVTYLGGGTLEAVSTMRRILVQVISYQNVSKRHMQGSKESRVRTGETKSEASPQSDPMQAQEHGLHCLQVREEGFCIPVMVTRLPKSGGSNHPRAKQQHLQQPV